MATLQDVEIFSVGTWNGMEFSLADLEQIADNFPVISHKPPLKFGHSEKQILDQGDGQPALGWVSSLKVSGNKLLATFQDMPDIVIDAIKTGRYKQVSSEIWLSIRKGGKQLGKGLKAVALLGADLPAVNDLKDLTAFLTKDSDNNLIEFSEGRAVCFSVESGTIKQIKPKEVKVTETKKEAVDNSAELGELRQFKLDAETKQAEAVIQEKEAVIRKSAQRFTKESSEFLDKVREFIKAKTLEPSYEAKIKEALESQSVNFTMESALTLPAELVLEVVQKFSDNLPEGEKGHSKSTKEEIDDDPSAQVASDAKLFMAEHGKSYDESVNAVLTKNPELAKAYNDQILTIGGGA